MPQVRAKKYANAKLYIYKSNEMFLKCKTARPNRHWDAACLAGPRLKLTGNGTFVSDDKTWEEERKNMKFFYLDEADQEIVKGELEKCKSEKEKDAKAVEMLGSLTEFMNKYPSKKIQLRCMPPPRHGSTEDYRVFIEDVLEILPLALWKQKVPVSEFSDYFKKLYEEFSQDQQDPSLHRTMSITRFEKILGDLDVDKESIAVLQDPYQSITRMEMFNRGRTFGIFGPDSDEVLSSSDAIAIVFYSLVVGENWTKEANKNSQMKKKILELMEECRKLDEEFYISREHLSTSIAAIKTEFSSGTSSEKSSEAIMNTYLLHDKLGDMDFPRDQYTEIARKFNLPIYSDPQPDSKRTILKAWMTRYFIALGWTQTFFTGPHTEMLKDSMMNNLLFLLATNAPSDAQKIMASVLSRQTNTDNITIGVRNVNLSAQDDEPNSFEKEFAAAMRRRRAAAKAKEAASKAAAAGGGK